MKIIAKYRTRVLADEDYHYLMAKGIPSVVYGETGIQALKENFKAEPIILAVQDEQVDIARELLSTRNTNKKSRTLVASLRPPSRNPE
ncbi:MAG: hypothetical protein LBV09_07300 [Deferribacteraceae bacterium]|jgi:ABC-type phosphate transport system permease subunit|nr:hypothetical protein [Deferribacteraceae bacterium]